MVSEILKAQYYLHIVVKWLFLHIKKGIFLYSAVSSPLDYSKCCTLHPLADLFILTPCNVSSQLDHSKCCTLHRLADLFIPTPTRLLWEAFQPCINYTRRLFTHIPPLSIAWYSFIQLCELGRRYHLTK